MQGYCYACIDVAWSVSVCLCIVHDREPCKNGRTDQAAPYRVDSRGPAQASCIRWGCTYWRQLANTTERLGESAAMRTIAIISLISCFNPVKVNLHTASPEYAATVEQFLPNRLPTLC